MRPELEFFSTVGKLKDVVRTGWQIYQIKDPEKVTCHSHRLALMSYYYAKKLGLDENKAMKIAIIHDIPEALAGDVPINLEKKPKEYPHKGVTTEQKHEKEVDALENMISHLPQEDAQDIRETWEEYTYKKSPEAKLVKELDKLELALQALDYAREKRGPYELDEFLGQGMKSRITIPELAELFNEIQQEYKKVKANGNFQTFLEDGNS
ncbi:MAG: HD domain-containing protein [DPANN group archaeon]|nr:HD domain-containing protein [DPANN group archaeon]